MLDAGRPIDRSSEIAAILAAGVLRLHARAALAPGVNPDQSLDSGRQDLELSPETVLSVSRELTVPRDLKTGRKR